MSKTQNNTNNVVLKGSAGNVTIGANIINNDYNFTLPSTAGNNTDVLSSGGSSNQLTWQPLGSFGGGTVSSVDMTTPTFLSISGNPITTSGTLSLTLSGTALPVLNGGTGTTTSTGTGSTVLSTSPTLTGTSGQITSGKLIATNTSITDVLNLNNNTAGNACYSYTQDSIGNAVAIGIGGTGLAGSTSGKTIIKSVGTGNSIQLKPQNTQSLELYTTGRVHCHAIIPSTSTTTGGLTVEGGVGVLGSVTTPSVQVAGTTSGIGIKLKTNPSYNLCWSNTNYKYIYSPSIKWNIRTSPNISRSISNDLDNTYTNHRNSIISRYDNSNIPFNLWKPNHHLRHPSSNIIRNSPPSPKWWNRYNYINRYNKHSTIRFPNPYRNIRNNHIRKINCYKYIYNRCTKPKQQYSRKCLLFIYSRSSIKRDSYRSRWYRISRINFW
jgi:hypothetical protein